MIDIYIEINRKFDIVVYVKQFFKIIKLLLY